MGYSHVMRYNPLTSEEKRVIEDKGTERPFTGEYDDFYRDGAYLCRRCDAPLYLSRNKFDAHCGWPAFDDEIPGAIKRTPDADGIRTEIACARCGAHLGHVFTGEKLTPQDTRHCVNSLSLRFVPYDFANGTTPSAVLGGGCFWCLDAAYRGMRGIGAVTSGYAGGHDPAPTYDTVLAGSTGHAEVVKIDYDPNSISYRQLLEIFFAIHDPTTLNRQGNDVGEQYRSIILYQTWRQKEEAEALMAELEGKNALGRPLVTEVKPLLRFYPAENYHQDYFSKHPDQAYCQAVIAPKLKKLRSLFPGRMKQ